MNSRCSRLNKAESSCETNTELFIERLKKIRALNCNPSDVGINSYILKRLSFNKLNVLTKFL